MKWAKIPKILRGVIALTLGGFKTLQEFCAKFQVFKGGYFRGFPLFYVDKFILIFSINNPSQPKGHKAKA
jgi:hypothetical protein